ncbi:potassium-transporting ATPase subunit KdpC [Brachymonas sp.]|uniref:potassium-transporting ATPase subunit KdpC n=1 Tax=Brachymonas sp. TaxID=1936292 RepID=UPI0035B2B593
MNTFNTPASEAESNKSLLAGLLGPCVRGAVFTMLVTGLAYPLATTGVAQFLLPQAANGSLIRQGDTVVGSAVIGQSFSEARYFHPRPSATTAPDPKDARKTVDAPYNAGASAGSNQGPTSQTLIDTVKQRAVNYRAANGLAPDAPVPVDAITASASGLDPHISLANAEAQLPRVAKARGLDPIQVRHLLETSIEDRVLGLLGEPRVNVLKLNLALNGLLVGADKAQPATK